MLQTKIFKNKFLKVWVYRCYVRGYGRNLVKKAAGGGGGGRRWLSFCYKGKFI